MSRLSYRFKIWKRKLVRATISIDPFWLKLFYKFLHKEKPNSIGAALEPIFKKSKGKVLQIGANDGMVNDPLFSLLYKYRWQAILLEPQRKVFDEELTPMYKRRREVKCIQAALSENTTASTLYFLSFSTERWATGLSSFKQEKLKEQIDNGYVPACMKKFGIQTDIPQDQWIASCKVPVLSFQQIFEMNDNFYPDVLIMDVEGYDATLLKLYPFQLHKPRAIVFETPTNPQEKKASEERLIFNQYKLQSIQRDTLAWLD